MKMEAEPQPIRISYTLVGMLVLTTACYATALTVRVLFF
jgi:hypothetical protein